MSVLRVVPLFALLLVVFNAMIVVGDLPSLLLVVLAHVKLPSGSVWSLTVSVVMLVLGALALGVEIVKSARATMGPLADHMLSIGVFLAFFAEFIAVAPAGNSTFMLVGFMSLLHALAGFTISLASAGVGRPKATPSAQPHSVGESVV